MRTPTGVPVKCDYCGNPLPRTVSWEELADTRFFFCDMSCRRAFEASGRRKRDIDKVIMEKIGVTRNYKVVPPQRCKRQGIEDCTKCTRERCIYE